MDLSIPRARSRSFRSSNLAVYGLARCLASPLWGWLGVAAIVIAYLEAIPTYRFSGAIVSAGTFASVESLFPLCRPVAKTPLCPWNWALFLFGFQLVVLPVSVLLMGPSQGVLPELPSHLAINMAMVMNAIAFVAFAVTYQSCSRKSTSSRWAEDVSRSNQVTLFPSRRLVQWNLLLGAFGLFLAFGSPGSLLGYFGNPDEYVERFVQASHTVPGVASLLLRPFLGFGLVMLWCTWIDRAPQRKAPLWTAVGTFLAMSGVILSYATFSYNRGAFVVPLVAMLAVLLTRVERVAFSILAVAGGVLLAVLFLAPFYAIYRNSDLNGNLTAAELFDDPQAVDALSNAVDPLDTIQMYGSGPQYGGFLLEGSRWGTRPYLGTTLFPSIVEPLPILGRLLDQSSGPVIYNKMIYGTRDIFDQIIPFSGELFLNFHIFGVIIGFSLLGRLAFWLQQAFEHASNALEVYIWQYAAVWVLFLVIGSISVVTQLLFYFCGPIYAYFTWKRIARRHSRAETYHERIPNAQT